MTADQREPDRTESSVTESGARGGQPSQTGARASGMQSRESASRSAAEERERDVPTSREVGTEGRRGSGRRRPFGLSSFGTLGNPFAMMQQLQSEMDQLFQDFSTGLGRRDVSTARSPQPGVQAWTPEVDVFRRGDELVVRADLPGIARENVSVDLEDDVLTIRGERRHESEEEREGVYWSERSFGSFERMIPLPEGVNESEAEASFKDGVLEITMPAPKEESPRKRRIEIR